MGSATVAQKSSLPATALIAPLLREIDAHFQKGTMHDQNVTRGVSNQHRAHAFVPSSALIMLHIGGEDGHKMRQHAVVNA